MKGPKRNTALEAELIAIWGWLECIGHKPSAPKVHAIHAREGGGTSQRSVQEYLNRARREGRL